MEKTGVVINRDSWLLLQDEPFSCDFYDGELEAINESLNDLIGQRQARTETADTLNQVAVEAQVLIQRIQAGAAHR